MEIEIIENLENLKKTLFIYPSEQKKQKSFLQMIGREQHENTISNLIAYFIDPNEDHCLNSILLQSFIDCLREKTKGEHEFLKSINEACIVREYRNTDILISDSEPIDNKCEWAIIVENKIFASLYNPFETYLDSIETDGDDNKVLVFLTLKELSNDEILDLEKRNIKYYPVLHEELLKAFKSAYFDNVFEMNDRTIFILKDFLFNMNILVNQQKDNPHMNKNLIIYQEKYKEIKAVLDFDVEVRSWIVNILNNIMKANGFSGGNSTNVKGYKQYWSDNIFIGFEFQTLFEGNKLKFNLGIQDNKLTVNQLYDFRNEFFDKLRSQVTLKESDYSKKDVKKDWILFLEINIQLEIVESNTLEKVLEDYFKNNFFNENGIMGILQSILHKTV